MSMHEPKRLPAEWIAYSEHSQGLANRLTRLLTPNPLARQSLARVLSTTLALIAFLAAPTRAQQAEPIRYIVRIPAPATHYLEVEATYPTTGKAEVELMMAVWTPGSYLVREFARHVEQVLAHN